MRAAIYNPYLDSLGGGERYSMAVATVLTKSGYRVDIEWPDQKISEKLEDRFGIDLSGVNFVSSINRGESYDICFWVSDGSIPSLKARKNFIHFQIPFHNIKVNTLLTRLKLFRVSKIICNSYFTKRFIDNSFKVESVVIYPPVPIEKIKPGRKENIILSVGRFSQLDRSKRQDLLVEAFKKIFDSGYRDWKLILAGGSDVGVGDYIKKLEKLSVGYPIKIFKKLSFKDLKKLYAASKIFWSASGFGINEEKEPEKVEHFGIAVVEAMASGCIPFAFAGGGHKEIIKEGVNGFFWRSISELVKKTQKVIDELKTERKISRQAVADSQKYSYERFEKEFLNLI